MLAPGTTCEVINPLGAGGMGSARGCGERPFDVAQGRPEPVEGRAKRVEPPARGGAAFAKAMAGLAEAKRRRGAPRALNSANLAHGAIDRWR